MQGEKAASVIAAVQNMTDREAKLLEVFLAGFQAGKQVSAKEAESVPVISQAAGTG